MTGETLDHTGFLSSLSAETRDDLTKTSDRQGLLHLGGHLALIAMLALWVGQGWTFWPIMLLPLGVSLAFLFTLQHECTHRTPFRSRWLNEVVGHGTGFLIFQPFQWFRAFHMAHHRFTNVPDRDPELTEPKPETPREFVWYLASLVYWLEKAATLIRNASRPEPADYLGPRQIPRIRHEARAMLAGYAALLVLSILWLGSLLFWIWILPLAIGFPFLRLYLLAEHGRCPTVANMFQNTRTSLTNRAVRFIAWNMPYHAEHHAYPAVPFHKLGQMHDLARDHLKEISPGYAAFGKDYFNGFRPDRP